MSDKEAVWVDEDVRVEDEVLDDEPVIVRVEVAVDEADDEPVNVRVEVEVDEADDEDVIVRVEEAVDEADDEDDRLAVVVEVGVWDGVTLRVGFAATMDGPSTRKV